MTTFPQRTWRPGFTLVELLVVISIIGVLVSLLLPAVQSARESARVAHCKNNLRQLAISLASHEDSKGIFPPARLEPHPEHPWEYYCSGWQPSWYARILPFIEQQNMADNWRLEQAFYLHPEPTRMMTAPVFSCPSRRTTDNLVVGNRSYMGGEPLPCGCEGFRWQIGGALGDYGVSHGDGSSGATGADTDFYHGGNGSGMVISARTHCGPSGYLPGELIDRITVQQVTDGLSNTLLLGEMHMPQESVGSYPYNGPIFDGDHLFGSARVAGPGYPIGSGPNDVIAPFMSFGSWHPGGCHFALGDGSVRSIRPEIDSVLLGRLSNRADGMPTTLP